MDQQPALSVQSVAKDYGTVQALKGISFDIKPGEAFGLLGPNGAGKTSLISITVTLERPTAGAVKVFGHDVTRSPRHAKMQLGWVPQEIINHGYFDVEEIMGFQAGYYGVRKPKERIEYLLKGLGLFEHRKKKVRHLSGGMKRRLMIAKALIHKPGLLLLDEPTAGVDVELRARLWDFVTELRNEGLSILLTTHYLEEAERLCDRVAIINRGEIRALDKTHKLIEQFSRKKISLTLRGSGEQMSYMVPMEKSLGQLLEELKVPADQLHDVQISDGSLEDVFMILTKEAKA